MKRYERLWERLLTLLGTLGDLEEVQPGRLRVQVDRHSVQIVMTRDEWDHLVSIPYGSFAGAAHHVLWAVNAAVLEHKPYLVYHLYELHPSPTPELPPNPEEEVSRRIAEIRAADPDAQFGWYAYPPGERDGEAGRDSS